jgi:hypothetical protein
MRYVLPTSFFTMMAHLRTGQCHPEGSLVSRMYAISKFTAYSAALCMYLTQERTFTASLQPRGGHPEGHHLGP